ncbi:MAG TPA: hypothetical protein VEL47_05975 [Myxococcota bacterium]|nr:hypothetical protein [Myxococcota bacterium]
MRTVAIILVLLVLAALGYLGYAHFSGGAVPTFGLPIGGDKATIRSRTLTFLENVKFKNTVALKDFVASTITVPQILFYVETSLGLNQEMDLNQAAVKEIEIDSAAQRARVRVTLSGQDLKNMKAFDMEKLVFLYNAGHDRWLIDTTPYPNY